MTQEDEIEQLQIELAENPKSGKFIRLAELYLSKEMFAAAEQLTKQSLRFFPQSISGLILLGRSYKKQNKIQDAIEPLKKATELALDNWRAWLELAECYLELKNGKQALTAYKKVLFLNPTHPIARRAVAKLETLSADEYEDDLFQMQSLPETKLEISEKPVESQEWEKPSDGLVRIISYIDALIVRHENKKAIDLLNDCSKKYGSHPEIETRRLQLSVYENPDFIQPKAKAQESKSKREFIRERKINVLRELLHRIEPLKSQTLST